MVTSRLGRVKLLIVAGVAAAIMLAVSASWAQAPRVPRIVGEWSGNTEDDGVLTLVVQPAPGHELSYAFSGGKMEHGSGTFTLRGANELNFTPTGETEAEKWTYSFDEQGHLRLEMEEDNPNDKEVYVLTRTK